MMSPKLVHKHMRIWVHRPAARRDRTLAWLQAEQLAKYVPGGKWMLTSWLTCLDQYLFFEEVQFVEEVNDLPICRAFDTTS
jgi:hypothetical protein